MNNQIESVGRTASLQVVVLAASVGIAAGCVGRPAYEVGYGLPLPRPSYSIGGLPQSAANTNYGITDSFHTVLRAPSEDRFRDIAMSLAQAQEDFGVDLDALIEANFEELFD
ncbi:hypothetical protein [Lysobacter enzymogenes]|uniref:hypothetical protein n=1 Tax=Lysobacter enzymogenes TaxID=69 RepID=UPI001AFB82C1|nr:hypothetical protein [Lysobacter enzymogenes]QQQ02908.1 hypothetical protein JHW41_08090 [Lysobacter enzymogenes]